MFASLTPALRRLRTTRNAIKPPMRSNATTPPTIPPIRAALSSSASAGALFNIGVDGLDVDAIADDDVALSDMVDDINEVDDSGADVMGFMVVDASVLHPRAAPAHTQLRSGFVEQSC